MRRWLAVSWSAVCLAAAASAALQMLVTFAPAAGRSEDAAAELAGLERARESWAGGVWLASGLLAVSGVAVAVLGWRRQAEPGAAADTPKAGCG